MKRAALLLAVAGCSSALQADTVNAQIGAPKAALPPLPSNFAAFSYEVSCIPNMFTFQGQPRVSFVNLLQWLRTVSAGGRTNMGPGPNIRIGGNSADTSAYIPAPAPLPTNISYRITDADFQTYAAVVPRWNGTITPGLNFRFGSNASLALAHLQALTKYVPFDSPILEAVEIGNENDLYYHNSIRSPDYKPADYVREWNSIVGALQRDAGLPASRVQGATWCCGEDQFDTVLSEYISDGVKAALLRSVSLHDYPLSVCGGHKSNTVYELLDNDASDKDPAKIAPFVQTALAAGVPFYIGEGNSVSCGGQEGVSNVFASTLWALDAMLAHANVGITRFNFHGCSGGAYTAIAYSTAAGATDTPDVRPLFYALWAMSATVANGARLLDATVSASNPLIRLWSVLDSVGQTRVVLIHKDANATGAATVSITPASGAATGTAQLTRLAPTSGLGVFANSTITFGGLTFDASVDGTPQGTPTTEPVHAAGGVFTFTLPPASVAILAYGA